MMNRTVRKVISLVAALCLALTAGAGALAEGAQDMADFEALTPLMDLVCAASQYSPNAPESVPGADGVLTVSFTDAFFKVGQTYGAEVGVTADMINDTNAQAELLSKIFAAQLPQLEPVVMTDDINGFIGFHPVTVNRGADSATVQIIGEIYLADKPMREMSEADYSNIQWLERAVFTFQSDSTALNGFRLMGYSVGTDLSLEYAMQGYFDQIAVEYESHLGFTLLYPAVFTDDLLVESDDGVSAELPDGSASFSAKRIDNTNGANLTDYVGIIANGITGSTSTINEESQYGTVAYTTEDGYYVFEVYIVTDRYIYQAELRFLSSLISQYSMYTSYLENSFVANGTVSGLSKGAFCHEKRRLRWVWRCSLRLRAQPRLPWKPR